MARRIEKSEPEWRAALTPEQYHVCRERGTERPFTGPLTFEKGTGSYVCACCREALFRSDTKFDSGSGWPSFWAPADAQAIEARPDLSHGMRRVEVLCQACGSHLGHVFEDGPRPTGLRYCINSVCLEFVPASGSTEG